MQVGARGADEQGAIFASSLKRSSVDVKKLRVGKGVTGAVKFSLTLLLGNTKGDHFEMLSSNRMGGVLECKKLPLHHRSLSWHPGCINHGHCRTVTPTKAK